MLKTIHAPWYQPGEGYAYANTNYLLLGLVIERVTGLSLSDELQARFLGRSGSNHTRMLTGAPDDGGPVAPAWATIFWASGAMSASAADLATWGDALFDGAVLTDASDEAMITLNRDDYGLGAQKIAVPGATGFGHTGMLNTYTTILLLPAQAERDGRTGGQPHRGRSRRHARRPAARWTVPARAGRRQAPARTLSRRTGCRG